MVILQRTTVYFRNVAGVMVPEVMEAGDVLVFRGDAVHCGGEWTESDQIAAMSKFGDKKSSAKLMVSMWTWTSYAEIGKVSRRTLIPTNLVRFILVRFSQYCRLIGSQLMVFLMLAVEVES